MLQPSFTKFPVLAISCLSPHEEITNLESNAIRELQAPARLVILKLI